MKSLAVTPQHNLSRQLLLVVGLGLGIGLVALCLAWGIIVGTADISLQTVWDALFNFDDTSFQHLVIRTVRMPRVLAGALVGAALAVAGAIMQGLTRNPLASPSILGVNAGAAFAVVLLVFLLDNPPLSAYALVALIGASVAAAIVYTLGSMGHGGASPLKLTLAGAVFTAFIGALTTSLLITDAETLDQIRFWTVGSLLGRDWNLLWQTAPYMLVGMVGALILARQITTISLGEDIATGLGQNTLIVKLLAAVMVVLLAGGAVALAGPIAFVGLVAPHIVRFLVGQDYRWILPYAAIMGAILLILADMAARIVIRPQELPVGIMMGLLGAPFFIYLARWKVKK
jgi:iron complex transport system permease protein